MKKLSYPIIVPLSLFFFLNFVNTSLAGSCVATGIGCIPSSSPADFAGAIVRFIVGVAGGIALLLLIVGGVEYTTSSGDPDAIDEAKGRISAAISGLLLILFSVLLLKLIGVDILGLPGFDINTGPGGGVIIPGGP